MPFGMFVFCCNECQQCWHRRNGSHPKNWDRREFEARLHEPDVKETLDKHEEKVRMAHILSSQTGVPIEVIMRD